MLIYKKNIYRVLDLCVFILLAILFIPQSGLINGINYITLLVGLSWFFIAFLLHPSFFFSKRSYFIKSLVCYLIMALIPFLYSNQTIMNRMISLSLVPMFYWIYSYNKKNRGDYTNIITLILSLFFIIYTSVQTFLALLVNPYASRLIKTDVSETIELTSAGVSGYSLIYSVVLFLLTILPLLVWAKKIRVNLLLTIIIGLFVVMFFVLIVMSNFFTALLITLFSGLAMLVLLRSKKAIFFLIPIMLFLVLDREVVDFSLNKMIELAPMDGKTYNRLNDIKLILRTGNDLSEINSRSTTTQQSIDTFKEYPILGYVINAGDNFHLSKLGQHSTLLDNYAFYGIFLGSFFLWIMWYPFKLRLSKHHPYEMRVFAWIMGVTYIVLIAINNLTPSMGYVAFFAFPTIYDFIYKKRYGSNSQNILY